MMGSRENILSKIRATADGANNQAEREKVIASRFAATPQGIIPARGQLPQAERAKLFEERAEYVSASVAHVAGYADIPSAVSEYLRARNLPASIRIGDDPRLAGAGWDKEKTLEIRKGASDGNDLAGVSHALGAVAETGTLVLASGDDNPTTINFLPEHHIVVLRADEIAGDMESIWPKLRSAYGKGSMPRALNMITGPSRSGDIEQTILLGAHGPRALHIIIVE